MDKKIKVVIIDDEPDSVKLIQINIEKYFPQVVILATFSDPESAIVPFGELTPDLLLLDIEMPVMNGFDFLEKIAPVNCSVAFVTAYNEFAVKAFKFNAMDYLLKPVHKEDLQAVFERVGKQKYLEAEQLHVLQQQFKKGMISKIAVPGQTGVSFVDLKDIIFIEASNNYSNLVLTDKKRLLISKTLKDIQPILEEHQFLRIHRQYIINLNEVKHFNRNDGLLTMTTGDVLPVSRLQKEKLTAQYGWL